MPYEPLRFETTGGATANGIAAWDGVTLTSLGTGLDVDPLIGGDPLVNVLAEYKGDLIVRVILDEEGGCRRAP